MADIRLIATDLDGTVVGANADFRLYNELREKLVEYRRRNNTVWATCTGRGLSSTEQFIVPMEMMGIKPDFLIVNHAFIYEHKRFGYFPHIMWNMKIRKTLRNNHRKVRKAISRWYSLVSGSSYGVMTVYRRKTRLRLRFRTEDAAISVEQMIAGDVKEYPYLKVVRDNRELDIFQLPFTKGLAVSELARHLSIDPDAILTIGDGYNDLSMLDQTIAVHTACPSNAESEVKYAVHMNKGHISDKEALLGVLDSMEAYYKGIINSDLPDNWTPVAIKSSSRRPSDTSSLPATQSFRNLMLFSAVAVTILLVVAWFNVIPFSGYILRPFYVIVRMFEKFISLFI